MRLLSDLTHSLHRLFTLLRPARVRWKRLGPHAKRPLKAYSEDGAFDIFAVEDITLAPGAHINVGAGIAVEVGPGWSYDLRGRSGLSRRGIIAALGLVDAYYHGEIRVVLSNLSGEPYTIVKGDRVGQIKFNPVWELPWEEVKEFERKPATRGANGWGSSGR